jgi:hypothetical protein
MICLSGLGKYNNKRRPRAIPFQREGVGRGFADMFN